MGGGASFELLAATSSLAWLSFWASGAGASRNCRGTSFEPPAATSAWFPSLRVNSLSSALYYWKVIDILVINRYIGG
jgi:hypothetical protein